MFCLKELVLKSDRKIADYLVVLISLYDNTMVVLKFNVISKRLKMVTINCDIIAVALFSICNYDFGFNEK